MLARLVLTAAAALMLVASPGRAFRGRTFVCCRDGSLGAQIVVGNRVLDVPACDTDERRDRRRTFLLYVGCEPPLKCKGSSEQFTVPAPGRRRVDTQFGQR